MTKGLVALLCFVLLVSVTAATQFKVGGTGQWKVPESGAKTYNQWAQANRFKAGDTIAFIYPASQDSVLVVDSNAYNSCDVSSPVDRFADGNTVFTLTRSGAFYFVSGNQDNCKNGEKLHVVVLANRNNSTGLAPSPSPSTPTEPPSPSTPAEAPSASSPPPPGEVESAPAASTPPPPNAASLTKTSLMGIFGVLFVPFFYILL